MIQLTILSGEKAGTSWVTRRFPVRIGRASAAELRLEEDGVWDEHLVLDLDRAGFSLNVHADALARINGQPVTETHLRNGDVIELGAVTLRFWLSPVKQRRLWLQEALTWGTVLAVVSGEVGLLYWLVK